MVKLSLAIIAVVIIVLLSVFGTLLVVNVKETVNLAEDNDLRDNIGPKGAKVSIRVLPPNMSENVSVNLTNG